MRSSKVKDYYIKEKIGSGAFGVVYRATKERRNYVIKTVGLDGLSSQEVEMVRNEAKVLAKLSNPYVVKHFESFIERKKLFIVMEHCEQGDLGKVIQRQKIRKKLFEERSIWTYFIQICLGLSYLHGIKVLHRDIKALNVFLTGKGEVRIGDLGVAKALTFTSNAKTMVGTPLYLSPEICMEKQYDHKSDVWSLGVLLYELISLKVPFNATNQGSLVLKIIKGDYSPLDTQFKGLKELVERILVINPAKRPSCAQILEMTVVKDAIAKFKLDYLFGVKAPVKKVDEPVRRVAQPKKSLEIKHPSEYLLRLDEFDKKLEKKPRIAASNKNVEFKLKQIEEQAKKKLRIRHKQSASTKSTEFVSIKVENECKMTENQKKLLELDQKAIDMVGKEAFDSIKAFYLKMKENGNLNDEAHDELTEFVREKAPSCYFEVNC